MRILLAEKDNEEIRGDLIPFIVKRVDLTPIPSTLEFLVRVNEQIEPFIQQGKIIALASPEVKYRIIYTRKQGDGLSAQGNPNFTLTKVIAILEGCYQLSFLTEKAIIKENTSLGELFRAAGATMSVEADIAVDKYSCLIGEYPSYSLMRAMGRSASTIVWNGENAVKFQRVRDLFEQKPVEILHQDSTQHFQSGFIERHETPSYYSNLSDGKINQSSATKGRRADFEMFADQQTLNNLSTYLVHQKVWTTRLTPNILAGDVIEIEEEPFVVITATHALAKAGSGSGSQLSRFWLGSLSNLVDKTK